MIARQKMATSGPIKVKRKIREQKPEEEVNIDGKVVKWGQFKKKFHEDIERMTRAGQQIPRQEFFINLGDPNKEKIMIWHP